MSIAQWCLFIAGFLPIVCVGIAKAGPGRYDNRNPREWLARREGYQARANAAQLNSWEAFALFTAAMLVAHHNGGAGAQLDQLAMAFIAARLIYIALYVGNLATARSLVWFVGIGLTVAIFFQSAPKPL